MIRTFFPVALALVAGSALAQDKPYAVVQDVSGIVTVSNESQKVSAADQMALKEGQEVLVGSAGGATVVFRDGCTAKLRPGQKLLVKESECKAFVAANSGAGAVTTATNSGVGPAIAIGVGAAAILSISGL